jgi:hypothetical protein
MFGGAWGAWEELRQLYLGQMGPYTPEQMPRVERVTLNEWEVVNEMAVSSVGGLFDQFIALATERWQKGVDEYRGGDEGKPFNGDPLEEAMEESADMYAYIKQGNADGDISDVEADQLNCLAYDAFKLLSRIKQDRTEKIVAAQERKTRDEGVV